MGTFLNRLGKKSTPPPDRQQQSALRVTRREARKRIEDQIAEGEGFLRRKVERDEQLDRLSDEYHIWSDFNQTLLDSIFANKDLRNEYLGSLLASPALEDLPFDEALEQTDRQIESQLRTLRSIHRRIELFPESVGPATTHGGPSPARATNKVFVVHGHDVATLETVARFLERLDLSPVILHEKADRGRTVIEKFEAHSDVRYAVVILTPDDVGAKATERTDLKLGARQNVILELGYFLGTLGRTHVVGLRAEDVEIPSDLAGVLYIPLDSAGAWKLKLAREMKAAGLDVDMNRAV